MSQYLKTTRDFEFIELSEGRKAIMEAGNIGFILDEEEIVFIPNASPEEKKNMLAERKERLNDESIYALVGGHPFTLRPGDYILLESAPPFCIGTLL